MTGRPSTFTQAKADAICELIAEGFSMRSICKRDDMPSTATVCKWLGQYPAFAEQYAHARDVQAETLFDEMLDIADDGTNDWMKNFAKDNPGWQQNGEAIQRSRLRIDARKWMLGKMKPKKYGDKTLLGSDPDNPLPAGTASVDVAELAKQLRKQKLAADTPQDAAKDVL